MHIVQLAEPPAVVETRRSNRVRKRRGLPVLGDGGSGWAPNELDIENIMLLEYFPRGSLYKAICTAVSKDVEFPNRVLWQMFHCRKSSQRFGVQALCRCVEPCNVLTCMFSQSSKPVSPWHIHLKATSMPTRVGSRLSVNELPTIDMKKRTDSSTGTLTHRTVRPAMRYHCHS